MAIDSTIATPLQNTLFSEIENIKRRLGLLELQGFSSTGTGTGSSGPPALGVLDSSSIDLTLSGGLLSAKVQNPFHKTLYLPDYPGIDNTGATDTKVSFTNALIEAQANGWAIDLGAGIYRCDTKLNLIDNLYMFGRGPHLTKIIAGPTHPGAIFSSSPTAVSNCTIRDLALDGGYPARAEEANPYILFTGSNRLVLDNVHFINPPERYMVLWFSNSTGLRMHNCYAKDTKGGPQITDNSSEVVIVGNVFDTQTDDAAACWGSSNVVISGNWMTGRPIVGGVVHAGRVVAVGDRAHDIVITGNYMEGSERGNVEIGTGAHHITVSGNLMVNAGSNNDAGIWGDSIRVLSPGAGWVDPDLEEDWVTEHIQITGNVMINPRENGVGLSCTDHAGNAIRHVNIHDNIIGSDGVGNASFKTTLGRGIHVDIPTDQPGDGAKIEYISIKNNTIYGFDREGIGLIGESSNKVTDVDITGNRIYDSGRQAVSDAHAIRVEYCNHLKLRDNTGVDLQTALPGGPSQLGIKVKNVSGVIAVRGNDMTRCKQAPYDDLILDHANLQAYYRFGEASGPTLNDSGPNNLDGTYAGSGITYGAAGALVGDTDDAITTASTDTASVPDNAALDLGDGPFTIEFWVKRSATQGANQTVLIKGNSSYHIRFRAANQIALFKQGVSGVVSRSYYPITDLNWHHVVFTKDGADRKVYVDGVDWTFLGTDQTMVDSATPLLIGHSQTGIEQFPGSLDELALYDEVLNASEVRQHYERGMATSNFYDLQGFDGSVVPTMRDNSGFSPWTGKVTLPADIWTPARTDYRTGIMSHASLKAYYRMGELDGTVLYEESGLGIDGTYSATGITYNVQGALTGDANTAVRFDGAVDPASVADDASVDLGNTAFSIEFWFRRSSNFGAPQRTVLSKGATSYRVRFSSSDLLQLQQSGTAGNIVTTGAITDQEWHHCVITKATSTSKIYIDGVDVTTAGTDQTLADTASALDIGHEASADRFDGALDELAFYSAVLTPEEVLEHYNLARLGVPQAWSREINVTFLVPFSTLQPPRIIATAAVENWLCSITDVTNYGFKLIVHAVGNDPGSTVTGDIYWQAEV